MGLLVVRAGLFTTVQDLGRLGFRAWGVPVGGAFDAGSASLANALVGNGRDAALIEMTLVGGTFEAKAPLALAAAGAEMPLVVEPRCGESRVIRTSSAFPLAPGERLTVGRSRRGARAYVAVAGGWRTKTVLGSRSSETPLTDGDILSCERGWTPVRRPDPSLVPTIGSGVVTLRVIGGPEAALLQPGLLEEGGPFRVSPESNRMGLRLIGPAWKVETDPERVSTPVAPGTVQVAGGQPLVLGVACGTMGGYPHVAHVISADLDRVGQVVPGDEIRFRQVSLREARRLDGERRAALERWLPWVTTACQDRAEPESD
jgi:biotin-dependent carboxylase-like uncharacterized protein